MAADDGDDEEEEDLLLSKASVVLVQVINRVAAGDDSWEVDRQETEHREGVALLESLVLVLLAEDPS